MQRPGHQTSDVDALDPIPPALAAALKTHMAPKHATFVDRLRKLGVIGEGSCLFHAILAALNAFSYNQVDELMKRLTTYVFRCSTKDGINYQRDILPRLLRFDDKRTVRNPAHFDFSVCNPQEDTGGALIVALIKLLNINLMFWNTKERRFQCGFRGRVPQHEVTVVILWNKSHFEPLVLTKRGSPHEMVDNFPGAFIPGHPLHRAVIDAYGSHCRSAPTWPTKHVPLLVCRDTQCHLRHAPADASSGATKTAGRIRIDGKNYSKLKQFIKDVKNQEEGLLRRAAKAVEKRGRLDGGKLRTKDLIDIISSMNAINNNYDDPRLRERLALFQDLMESVELMPGDLDFYLPPAQ